MATNDLKLLGAWFSPFVARVQIALTIKGVNYENIEETLFPKSDLLLQYNPIYKKIPVLIHGDKLLCESAIIVEYIDEVWKNIDTPSILPSNAYDRAIAKFWVAYIDDKLCDSMRNVIFAHDDVSMKTYFEQLEEVLVTLEDLVNKSSSEGNDFIGGDNIGSVDIAFGSFLSWLRVIEKMVGKNAFDEAKTPSLVKWAESFAADPAVKGILPETDKLMECAKVMIQREVEATPK